MKKVHRKEAGFLLITRRKPKQQKNKSLQKCTETTRTQDVNKDAGGPAQTTLNGRLLLQLHRVDKPSHLCTINISGQNLTSVEPEELMAFVNVAYVDASDNFLSLGSFSSFTSLKELSLALNRIKNMDFDVADFPHLEVLNLSFNALPAEVLLQFGQFPRLKTLDLTRNDLNSLPPNFGASHSDPSDMLSEEGPKQFEALEVLILENNRLTSSVFYSLTNLKRLKHLNLEGNRITEIPCKEVMESSKPALREGEQEDIESKIDHHIEIMKILHALREEGCRRSSVFLPELQYLNLANNKIASEEAMVAAALFPNLCELDIRCNPLRTLRRGETPLLTYFLQDKLGIKIKRGKEKEFVKLPQKPLKMPFKSDSTSVRRFQDNKRPEDKNKSKSLENTKHFFITQTEEEAKLHDESAQNRACPGRPIRYDLIMDVKPLPYIGIQTAVRMLDQTLRSLNIYRDSKPRLDSIQTPYREMKKRIVELPPLRPLKQPIERVEELIKEIKDSRAAKVVSLGSVMHNRAANSKDYKEALFLLRDLRKTHKMVHDKTMEQEARFQCEHPH
ncbi:X-ray radiation resistance-associated protein 1 [Poeciliopsis prolifica]|uniref:X-ray radiation resistance-associated protein 1 n=1 Tax=Poeciliopsis prolifica TaxID=188132 RepID=UPI0024136FD7|nr:X-ray radiation resistance-associated protein 1 [Poeciliopsis prolifica]XP_054899820.1 X-ray radiation resistance-associated protein 1 [Poeciliopsis prolifica]XP_054899821.1 X-ray radiation resistance-associated protein 1 [Poeciliopsis prolifica]